VDHFRAFIILNIMKEDPYQIKADKETKKYFEILYGKTKSYKAKKNDPMFKLNHNIASGIGRSKVNRYRKHWTILVGYTLEDLKKHLESQFKDGMNWGNYGRNGWVVDHRVPLSLFNITSINSKEFKACWALENLQPMWEEENLIKHNRLLH